MGNKMDRFADISASNRSRVTNARLKGRLTSKALFAVGADGRSAWGRRYRDLTNSIVADLGGLDRISEVKLGLARRMAALTIEAEKLEAALAAGKRCDLDLLARLSGHVRRIADQIGLEKVRREEVPPSLAELAAKHRKGGA